MMVDARSVALVGMGCSGVAILSCLFVVPLIYSELHHWTTRVQLHIQLFKARTDDSWNQMMILRRDLRTKRQAGEGRDFLDQLDEDIFTEFGENFGYDDFLDPIPSSPRSLKSKPLFARPEPSFDPRPPAFEDVRLAPAARPLDTLQQLHKDLFGRGPDGRLLFASIKETQDPLISADDQPDISEASGPQGSVESGYTASPGLGPEDFPIPAPNTGYDPAPSSNPALYAAPPPLPAYRRPVVPTPPRRPASREATYSKRQPEPRRTTYSRPKSQCNCKKLYCPAGPPGDPGLPGRNGRQGEAGSGGLAGLDGPNLEPISVEPPCTICHQGPLGRPGYPGNSGADGGKGIGGLPGSHGRDGSQGSMGGKGPIGPSGPKGKAGYKGFNGLDLLGGKGQPGKKGPPGINGPSGQSGKSGKSFYQPGPPGYRGSDGRKGREGVSGIPGLPGSHGERGGVGADVGFCPCPEKEMQAFYQTPESEKGHYPKQ